MGISSYNRSVAAEFLLKWGEDIPGAERLPGGSQSALDWQTMDGLTASSSLHCAVTCCMLRWTESRQSASSVTRPTSSSSLCTGHRGCGSSTTSKWRSGMAVGLRYGVVPVRKRKKSAIKLLEMDIPRLEQVLGQPDASHRQLKATADSFYLPVWTEKLYGNECSSCSLLPRS